MVKVVVGIIFLFIQITGQTTSAANLCKSFFDGANRSITQNEDLVTENIRREVTNDIASNKTLQDILKSDVELETLSKNPDFINFIVGLSEGRSLDELQYSLFRVWKSADSENINLNKTLTKELLAEVQKASHKPEFKSANRMQRFRYNLAAIRVQLVNLFKSMRYAKQAITEELHQNNLDGRVFDFYGYLNLKLDVSAMRPWNSIVGSFGAIRAGQVKNINPVQYARISMMASEIEEPVNAYSDNSGEVLRVISPQATRFMGKTTEEAEAHRKKGDRSYCTNSWCVEENRHEGVLARMAQNIVGWELPVKLPFSSYPNLDPMNPKDSFFHLLARNDTEWHAGSAYFLLASHSEGPLREWIMNVTRDEVKHMSLFGGLYKYLKGDTYNARLGQMLKKTWIEIKEKSTGSDYGKPRFSDAITFFEIAYIHIVYEKQIRNFFKSLPLKSLRKIYETEVHLKPLDSEPIDAVKQEKLNWAIEKETSMRKALARWTPSQREAANRLEYFEFTNNRLISDLIVNKFETFQGAELYQNSKHQEYMKRINALTLESVSADTGVAFSKAELDLLKKSLSDTLRDYQIFNNQTVIDLGLHVVFQDAVNGFDIARDGAYDAVKKVRENR